jgi:acetylornithine deacetylase/succinyl-diaminopimelate desuccinylase-like protein
MCRLTLTPSDKAARDWLVSECKTLGCDIKIDQMGNIFAIRPGTASDKAPIGMGSHMDTQPAGGRYVLQHPSDHQSSKSDGIPDMMVY